MEFLTDRFLFYGGMAAAAFSLAGGGICFAVAQIKKIRLNAQLDEEYGMREEKKGKEKRRKKWQRSLPPHMKL